MKEIPSDLKVGTHIVATLNKVTKQKISSTFKETEVESKGMSELERKIDQLWQLIEEESQKDIEAQKKILSLLQVDSEVFAKLGGGLVAEGDEIDRQVRDLKELEEGD